MLRALCCWLVIAAVALPSTAAPADTFKPFKLKTLEGDERTLSDVLGKATLVVFFFPTCPYCNAAFPAMQRIYDTHKPAGLSMVWINVVPDEQRLIAGWRTKHGYTVPVLLGGRSVPRDYRVKTTPTHYLLNSSGAIVSSRAGFQAGDERALEADIVKLLEK